MRKKLHHILFAWLLLSGSFSVLAQKTLTVEQLRDSIEKYKMTNSGKFIYFSSQLEKKIKEDGNDIQELIRLKINIAGQLIFQRAFDLAIRKTQEAIILADLQKNNQLKADAYKTLGNIYFEKEAYISAIKYYSVSDSLANNKLHSLKIRYNYSGIKQRIGDYEEALEIKLSLYDTLAQSKNPECITMNINNVLSIINIYKMLIKKDPQNKQQYLNGIEKFSKIYENFHTDVALYNIIFSLSKLSISLDNSFKKDMNLQYDSLQHLLWKKNIHFADRMIFYDEARYYYLTKQYDKALRLLIKIDSIEKISPNGSLYRDEIDMLYSKVYQALGQNELALHKMEEANMILNKKERQRANVAEVLRKSYDFYSISKKMKKLSIKTEKSLPTPPLDYLLISIFLLILYHFRKEITNIKLFNDKNRDKNLVSESNQNKYKKVQKKEVVNKYEEELSQDKAYIPKSIVENSLKKLKQYEQTKLYLSLDADLDALADFLGLNRVYTSKILNDYLNVSFAEYINQLRIKYAIRQIEKNTKFRDLSIEMMAKRVGFSKSSFIRVFAQETGFTPYQYVMKVKKSLKSL